MDKKEEDEGREWQRKNRTSDPSHTHTHHSMKKHFFFFGGKRKGLLRGGEPCLRVLLFPASRMHFHSLFIRSSIPSLHLLPFPLSQTQCSSLRNSTASSTSFSSCPAREASANPPSQPSWRSRSLLATRPLACSISTSVDPRSRACSDSTERASISLLQGNKSTTLISFRSEQRLLNGRVRSNPFPFSYQMGPRLCR